MPKLPSQKLPQYHPNTAPYPGLPPQSQGSSSSTPLMPGPSSSGKPKLTPIATSFHHAPQATGAPGSEAHSQSPHGNTLSDSGLTPTGRFFEELKNYSETESHPLLPTSPTGLVEPMSPHTAAFTHIADNQFPNKPFGNELGLSGHPSPGGTHFVMSQSSPIVGDENGVIIEPKPGDTRVAHTHPGQNMEDRDPSDQDYFSAYWGGKYGNPPRQDLMKHTPINNQSGTWYTIPGDLIEGEPYYYERSNPYKMGSVTLNPDGLPQTRIPGKSDLIVPESP